MRFVCLLALVLGGCSSRAGSRADTTTIATPTGDAAVVAPTDAPDGDPPPADPAPPEAEPAADAEPPHDPRCDELHAEVVAALATLPSPCTANDDCVCYNGGIQGFTGCGGPSDKATADRIYRVVEGYRELERREIFCPHGLDMNCSPRMCRAACIDGVCGNAPEAFPTPAPLELGSQRPAGATEGR